MLEIRNDERTIKFKTSLASTLPIMLTHKVSRQSVGLLWLFERFRPHELLHYESNPGECIFDYPWKWSKVDKLKRF